MQFCALHQRAKHAQSQLALLFEISIIMKTSLTRKYHMSYVISVVIPAYNEELTIENTAAVLGKTFTEEKIPYELIFVDDGSRDQTWQKLETLSKENSHVVGIHFSRNFGKEAAIFAGLAQVRGDCAIVMDCDLQHPPATAVEMVRLWQQGY